MPKQKLKESVEQLRSELSQTESLPDEQREELTDLAARIDAMLNGENDHWEEKLVDGLEQKLLEYEEEHPVIARLVSEIVKTLSNIGV
ncbi:MAG: DUF4404 family protein [Pseudomonadales bacterium]|nr:DUF4404 family protein [Pseudomonadales bacterium]